MLRDFNDILSWAEKWGSRDLSENQMKYFRSMLADCGLSNLGFSGIPFTWCNNREGQHKIMEQLDRFLANHK